VVVAFLIGDVIMFWLFLAIIIAAWMIGKAIATGSRNRLIIAQAQIESSPEYQKKRLVTAKRDEMYDDVVEIKREHFEAMTKVLLQTNLTAPQKALAIAKIQQKWGEDDEKRRLQQSHLEEKLGTLPENTGRWMYKWQELYDSTLKEYYNAKRANPIGYYDLEAKKYYKPGSYNENMLRHE
jgi:hypothetical protein